MDAVNPRWLWVVIFGVGTLATFGFLVLSKMTKERFAEFQRQQQQLKIPPVEADLVVESVPESTSEIKSTSEELPEVEIKP